MDPQDVVVIILTGIGVVLMGVGLVVAVLAWLRPRPPTSADEYPYDVGDVDWLFDIMAKPGDTKADYVQRPELAAFQPDESPFLLVCGPAQTGKTFAAYRVVVQIQGALPVQDLTVLRPRGPIIVPDGVPDGCGRHVVLFLDNLHDIHEKQNDLFTAILQVHDLFTRSPRVHLFCVVATTQTDYSDLINEWSRTLSTPITLTYLTTETEQDYIRSLCKAFEVEAKDSVIQELAEANDGTVVAIYDRVHQVKSEGSNTITTEDAADFKDKLTDYWRDFIEPFLPERQRQVVGLLSMMRACGVPLHSWIVEHLARQEDLETEGQSMFLWPLFKGRQIKTAMDKLARTWIPLSEAGEFTPHDSRLQLDRENIIKDACFVARALGGLSDKRPVPVGLRDAYAGLESIFYTQERYHLLLPLLQAWIRTSIRPGKEDPRVSYLIAQFDSHAQPPPPDSAEWAALVGTVAIRYCELPTGSRAASLHKAIACYQGALRVYTEDAFPTDWATTQNNLGAAYSELPTGDRAQNLQRALTCCQAALTVYTEDAFPADWAMTQNNLGTAYSELPTGDRGANLQQAIACYLAALRVWTEDAFPTDWAGTQNNLGNAYSDLPTGDRAENLQQAIACYQAALRVYTQDAFPVDWAMTQNNLGNAYCQRPTGDRSENLQEAIACYQAAVRVYTQDAFPVDWAMTQNNLGFAYSDLPTGERGENLQQAIACYQAALRVWTEGAFPVQWAVIQNNLGNAYQELPTGDRGHNLQQAIGCYQAALHVRTEDAFPVQWAMTQNNLGNAYLNLPHGDRGGFRQTGR